MGKFLKNILSIWWGWWALGGLALVGMIGPSTSDDASPVATYQPSVRSTDERVTINRVDRTLSPQERDHWQADPNSYGFNEDDRAFLKEHGVSESEARAAETVLRENGVD